MMMRNKVWEQIRSTKQFKKVLEELPKDEREQIEKSLQALCETFAESVLSPLEQLTTNTSK
jgi:mRNA-degrading endonuclease RelE of RelBE toxin-antitoxin system